MNPTVCCVQKKVRERDNIPKRVDILCEVAYIRCKPVDAQRRGHRPLREGEKYFKLKALMGGPINWSLDAGPGQ
jgi:hypothetical protein